MCKIKQIMKFEKLEYPLYIVLLLIIASYFFLNLPVTSVDYDLWFHLNGGRYIAEKGKLATESFYSFLEPVRNRVDYCWLFRIIIYKIFTGSGYAGLIIFRNITYFLLLGMIALFLFKGLKTARSKLFALFFFICYMLIMVARYNNVRPHILTYLLLTITIYLFSCSNRKILLLPIISIIWLNIHGITFPLLYLLCFAYSIDFFIKKSRDKNNKNTVFSIIFQGAVLVSVLSVFLTPQGNQLLKLPFQLTKYTALIVQEMEIITPSEIFSININNFTLLPFTIFQIFLFFSTFAIIFAIKTKKINLSDLVIFLGAVVLCLKGNRFIYVFALLSLPIVKNYLILPANSNIEKRGYRFEWKKCCIVILLMVIVTLSFNRMIPTGQKYPLSNEDLPKGVVHFLKKIKAKGNILHHPNIGGYLEWELYPEYKIAMDIQIPQLFSEIDAFLIVQSLIDENIFNNFLKQYDIPFVIIPMKMGNLSFMEKRSDYTLVFFDDSEVLYVNNKKYPKIAKKYHIKAIDPYTIEKIKLSRLSVEEQKAMMLELLRLYNLYPYGRQVNQLLAMMCNKCRLYEQASKHADFVIAASPRLAKGYRLKGDSLILQSKSKVKIEKALSYYKKALSLAGADFKKEVYMKIGSCYLQMEEYTKAYKAFEDAKWLFSPKVTYKYLYAYGLSAYQIGKYDEARMLFILARLKVPKNNTIWASKIQNLLENGFK